MSTRGWCRNSTDIIAGTEASYAVSRYDASGNLVTEGTTTVWLYSDGCANKEFDSVADGPGGAIASITIADTLSFVNFYYYDDLAAAVVAITASDTNTAPDTTDGIDDDIDNLGVLPDIVANNSTGSHSILYGMTADHATRSSTA